ncbi:YcnI family copper-binding membrane protein [Nocardioides antri]|uniref:YcnI family protein n=1 Tax=Nocardioides antri TaxID=2607659 RepID=A0A5B1LYB3_9ACTN|nr:YcnI family protein [Nocardioides antri]KAA1425672.1 YcnI family protein [Nocardioides antri]
MHIRRTVLPAAGALTAIALMAAPAAAHVSVTPSATGAGAYTVLTFSVPHGCDGSPTTRVAIDLPAGIYAVTPTRNPYWNVEKVMDRLEEPITDGHGNKVTERVAQVVYTARTPLPDGQRDTFELSLQLPDAEGETLAFPVVQGCERGVTGWTEVAADGQDAEALEHPAPLVTITAADEPAGRVEATDEEEVEEGGGLALAGLGAGILGVVLGGLALARSRRA